MGDSAKSGGTSKPVKFWDGVKAEFKKITWPDKDALLKQSVAVVIISVVKKSKKHVKTPAIKYSIYNK